MDDKANKQIEELFKQAERVDVLNANLKQIYIELGHIADEPLAHYNDIDLGVLFAEDRATALKLQEAINKIIYAHTNL